MCLVQFGIPSSTPSGEQKDFWEDFFKQADQEFNDARENAVFRGEVIPSPSLRAKHDIAVTEYGVERYFQMQQLEYLFDWSL